MSTRFASAGGTVALCLWMVGVPIESRAEITRLVIASREPAYEAVAFDAVGAYEWLIGHAEGVLDPRDRHNAAIVNLDKAPRNARGLVEYRMDVQILKPVDVSRSNGRLFYDVVNRGDKRALGTRVDGGQNINDPRLRSHLGTGFLLRRGYVLVWSGWQADLTAGNGRMRASFPVAVNAGGAPVVATQREEFIFDHATNPATAALTYPSADLDPARASLTVRQHERDARQRPADLSWSYDGASQIRIQRPRGFDAGAIYEFIYSARDPVVTGIAFAAVRDIVSFLRYAPAGGESGNPLAGHIQKAMGLGISQSGRFLRDLVYQDFNLDERDRIVFDGLVPIVSGSRRTQVNRAFSMPGRFSRQHEDHSQPDHEFPFAYQTLRDPVSGRSDGVLARCAASRSCPKILHVDTDSELFSAGASLIVTDPAGRPQALPDNVRAYLMAGSEHAVPDVPARGVCQQLSNPLNYAPHIRALVVALDEWVTNSTPPPDTRFPSVADGTLVPSTHPRAAFPPIPGFRYTGLVKQPRVFDFSQQPPAESGVTYPVFVGVKDEDGNNVAGVRHPYLQAPVATHTGWNPRAAGYAENALCNVIGSHIPFAATRTEREATRDGRRSLEERYPTPDAYARAVADAAERLVADRLLLREDAERLAKEAAAGGPPWTAASRSNEAAADEREIRATRDASNRAIAAHDADVLAASWMDTFHIVTSTSEQRAGREANRQAFRQQFAARPDVVYVRQPSTVTVFGPWKVASERGTWTGRWTETDGRVEIGGDYLAQWRKVGERWLLQSEVFVPTTCAGSKYCAGRP